MDTSVKGIHLAKRCFQILPENRLPWNCYVTKAHRTWCCAYAQLPGLGQGLCEVGDTVPGWGPRLGRGLFSRLPASCASVPVPTEAAHRFFQVLIVVPFREAALRVVQLFISLLEGDSKKKIIVSNKKRFNGEYGSDPEERPPNLKRPEDYEAVFVGNIDDHFRIGNSFL